MILICRNWNFSSGVPLSHLTSDSSTLWQFSISTDVPVLDRRTSYGGTSKVQLYQLANQFVCVVARTSPTCVLLTFQPTTSTAQPKATTPALLTLPRSTCCHAPPAADPPSPPLSVMMLATGFMALLSPAVAANLSVRAPFCQNSPAFQRCFLHHVACDQISRRPSLPRFRFLWHFRKK